MGFCFSKCNIPYSKNIEYIKISINTDERENIHTFIIDKYLCENFIKWTLDLIKPKKNIEMYENFYVNIYKSVNSNEKKIIKVSIKNKKKYNEKNMRKYLHKKIYTKYILEEIK